MCLSRPYSTGHTFASFNSFLRHPFKISWRIAPVETKGSRQGGWNILEKPTILFPLELKLTSTFSQNDSKKIHEILMAVNFWFIFIFHGKSFPFNEDNLNHPDLQESWRDNWTTRSLSMMTVVLVALHVLHYVRWTYSHLSIDLLLSMRKVVLIANSAFPPAQCLPSIFDQMWSCPNESNSLHWRIDC